MKKITKFIFMVFAAALALTACSPDDNHSLGDYNITQDSFSFDLAPTPESDEWTYDFAISFNATPKCIYSTVINFGDDESVKKVQTGTHEYIVLAGTYTATCIITLPTGEVFIKEKTITVARNNPKAEKDDTNSLQFALTGGKANVDGKTWKIGSWTAMRNPDNREEVWWDFKNDAVMNDEYIFIPNNVFANGGFRYENHGDTHMNESLGHLFPDGNPDGSFVTTQYTPPTGATWEISVRDGKTFLTINKGFIAYPAAPEELNKTEFEVISFTPTNIRLINVSTWDGWCYELTSETIVDPLTGTGSKTWVIDGNNTKTAEVREISGLNIKGFMGLGPGGNHDQEWWGADAGNKSFDDNGWTLYDWKITFTSTGQLNIATAGEGYGRKAFDGEGFTSTSIDGDDMLFAYDGGNYTYTFDKNAEHYPKLTLSGNAFMGYYCGTQDYEVIALSESVLAVAVHNTKEGQDWVLVFVPEGEQ